jgi:5-enolpyruvylshikimate-3-phosphate synthase
MALACILTLCGGTLDGCECVKKSYPHFFEDIRKINAWWEEV